MFYPIDTMLFKNFLFRSKLSVVLFSKNFLMLQSIIYIQISVLIILGLPGISDGVMFGSALRQQLYFSAINLAFVFDVSKEGVWIFL